MELKDLLVEHDYYCSDSNYYSNDPYKEWDCWYDFYEEYINCDIDMNLIFRWDLKKKNDLYWIEIFIMHQRKGIFAPHTINNVYEKDIDTILELLTKHYNKLQSIWEPLNTGGLKC